MHLHCAFQERRLDARVIDTFAQLPHEELDDRIVRPIGQEARQLEEGVDPGCDHDVEVDLGVDPLDARDVPAEAERRGVDESLDAAVAQPLQLRDRVGNPHLLVPVARAPDVAEVDERLRVEHEHVLVHQRRAEVDEVDEPRTVSTAPPTEDELDLDRGARAAAAGREAERHQQEAQAGEDERRHPRARRVAAAGEEDHPNVSPVECEVDGSEATGRVFRAPPSWNGRRPARRTRRGPRQSRSASTRSTRRARTRASCRRSGGRRPGGARSRTAAPGRRRGQARRRGRRGRRRASRRWDHQPPFEITSVTRIHPASTAWAASSGKGSAGERRGPQPARAARAAVVRSGNR